jgi:pimeloyl-ACP methyl ester carboxylesterase
MLIHGAWHGAWCWDATVGALRARGHAVIAPDLPGMGDDPTPLADLSFDDWIDRIVGLVDAIEGPIVLVGHSRGGIVISQVAERRPDRIARLVYLSAFLVPDGLTLQEVAAPAIAHSGLADALESGDGFFRVDGAKAAAFFFTDCTEQVAAAATARLCPEPSFSMTTPLRLGTAYASVPRAYVECTRDAVLPLSVQRSMRIALPCDPVLELLSGHSPFLSMPDQLADRLIALG